MLPNHIWLAQAPQNHQSSSNICRNGTALSGNAWSIIVKKKKSDFDQNHASIDGFNTRSCLDRWDGFFFGLLSDLAGQTQPGVDRRWTDQMNVDSNRYFSWWPYSSLYLVIYICIFNHGSLDDSIHDGNIRVSGHLWSWLCRIVMCPLAV